MAKAEVELKTDLDHNLNLKEEQVIVSDGKLSVLEKGKEIVSCRLVDIERAYVENGFGINKLVIRMKTGEEREFAYFTKEKSANFGKFAEAVNNHFSKGSTVKLTFAKEKGEKVNKVHTLLWLYNFGRKYRRSLIIGLIISVLLALVNLIPPYLLKVLIDNVILAPTHSQSLFPLLIATLLAASSAAMVLSMLQSYILNKTGNKIVTEMRNKLFAHVIRLPPSFIDKMSTGRIISRLISDAGNTQWLMTFGLPTVVINMLTILGIGAILFTMYPALAVYVLIPVPFVIWLVIRYRRRANIMYYRNWRRSADMLSSISDIVPNYTIVKSASKEKIESDKFGDVTDRYFNSQVDLTKLNLWHWPVVGFITGIATLVIWWVGGNLVIAGTIQLGVITAFIAYLAMFYNPINQLGNIIPFVQQSITSGQRLREILDEEVPALRHRVEHKTRPKGDIEFRGVSFEYMHPFPTIKDVNFKIKAGSKTVFVGKSGSGKTTLAKLLLRLYELKEGKITIGGKNIANFGLGSLRNGIAYVPQEAVLFDNSVAYNVAYYSPTQADPLEIMLACSEAAIHSEIMRMPQSYDTNIGERGYALSGGQRQRLSIARAVLTNPNIVVLDEVTSNLDAINASEVEETIEHFTRGRTSISITHDANEILDSDYAIVVENGRVVEAGTPHALLEKKGGKLSGLMRTKSQKQFLKKRYGGLTANKVAEFITSASQISVAAGRRPSLINVSYKRHTYKDLMPQLPFPITNPQVVIFNDREGRPVLLVNDANRLAGASNVTLAKTLNVTNFKLRITQIEKVLVTGDGVEWLVKTDRGKRKVITESRRSVRDLGKKLVLIDREGSVFEAVKSELDPRSQKIIQATI
ncbi:MAG: ABC transporter ATP-binding protein/permease [Candidatus Micrarchaeales archaeon]|nr:ABC transporter ATP-binding protein/permease [Candidatus Micrarchaeales archaeon]